ncbi:acyl carrier protein [Streptomyces sp. NPDC001137]|uniref:acyl carrier protein n=1 Tax=Streptomyces sp. NPDC001137 TaxID=3154378 RepID=UPI003316D556
MDIDLPFEPSSHLEEILRLVRELLGRDDVGYEDDFMAHGGNSLKAARLLWHVQDSYGVEVPMREFFDRPTAAGLAYAVERFVPHEADGSQHHDGSMKEDA